MTKDSKLFPFTEFEPKWQAYWEKAGVFRALDPDDPNAKAKKKIYILDMFPYPSAAGLHVGHPEGYTATDIISRYKRMRGFNVLHPIGWDAFGLPAEQYAIKTGIHPRNATEQNIKNFRKQIKRLGFSYDWDREVDTTDPYYYRWTQWIFLKLFEKGLAYEAEVPVWWCEKLGCVLANEEVIDGKSERGGYPVVRKPMRQWMLKITAYAERLLEDIKDLEWPDAIKEMQKNWVGKSIGAEVVFKVHDGSMSGEEIRVFTTRPDTLFGATYMVLAPEHPLVKKITTEDKTNEIEKYIQTAAKKNELERTQLEKVKTGVFTGAYAVNPVNQEKIPIWIADYVLLSYGTGAIMAVPAHDQRDYEFAKKFNLEIREVISGGDITKEAYQGEGVCVQSGLITGLKSSEGKSKIIEWLHDKKLGRKSINYKLRDWLFSRQRYWGEPIPIIHCASCGPVPLPESELPLRLPEVKDFKPTGTSEPPLAKAKDWVKAPCPKCGKEGRRETNTMPQWAGSCWYYLRYIDPKNASELISKNKEKYWMNVDLYVGGAEHAVLHLLYSRFWHKVLYDIGLVSTKEPFGKLVNQGIILGEDNQKMSKSRGNVVNPDEVIDCYGADSMRLYEMFMGPLEQSKAWSTRGVEGVYRFLGRVWRLLIQADGSVRTELSDSEPDREELKITHELIQKVTSDLDRMAFNTAISAFMIFLNAVSKRKAFSKKTIDIFLKLLNPFAPHLSEELWSRIGHRDSISLETWPSFDKKFIQKDSVEIVVQVNGKLRARLTVPSNISEEDLKAQAQSDSRVKAFIDGKKLHKVIVVPRRLVNIVAK